MTKKFQENFKKIRKQSASRLQRLGSLVKMDYSRTKTLAFLVANMSQDHSFNDLMVRLRAGNNDAAARIFDQYSHRLISVAQKRLGSQVRRKIDPEDVLQSVFRSFFARQAAGEMDELAGWDSLWGMLVVITLRKCGRRLDYFHAACRDVGREASGRNAPDQSGVSFEASSDIPTPQEEAMMGEAVERLLAYFEGRHRDIVTLSLQGYTIPEVSAEIGCTERTVYRVLERVKQCLEQMRETDNE
jgi:RNA polymerase sigma-70 factor (ECF subfamily)